MSQEGSKQIFWVGRKVRYVKFVVLDRAPGAVNGNGNVLQMSRLELLRRDGSLFNWPASTISTCEGVGSWPSGEWQNMVLDHSVYTKMCPNQCTFPTSFIFDVGASFAFNANEFVKWQWWTANDTASCPGRNPGSFRLQFSEIGIDYITVDEALSWNPPAENYALGYEGDIKL